MIHQKIVAGIELKDERFSTGDGTFPNPFSYQFERSKLNMKARERMIKSLRKSYKQDPGFLNNLPGKFRGYHNVVQSIFYYDYVSPKGKVIPLAIKDNNNEEGHGSKPKKIRLLVAELLKELKNDDNGTSYSDKPYKLNMPILYGSIAKNLIVMERLRGENQYKLSYDLPYGSPVSESLKAAVKEYHEDLWKIHERNPSFPLLHNIMAQIKDLIVVGHTNPQNLDNGKWVFFIPYDLK